MGELTVVNKRMHRKRAHDGAIACGDRRAGASAVSDVPSGQTLRYAAPQRAQLGGERLRTKDGGNEAQDGLQINTVRVVAEAPQDVEPRLNTATAGAIVGKAISPGRAKQPRAWIGIVLRCCGSATWMSTVRYRPSRPPDAELRGRLRDLAHERRRFGYRRLFVLLRREGDYSGINRIYRLYREEGLAVRKRRRPKYPASASGRKTNMNS